MLKVDSPNVPSQHSKCVEVLNFIFHTKFNSEFLINIYYTYSFVFLKMEEAEVDISTSLRSEIAALQYKRDKLQADLEEMRSQMRSRDQRCIDLQVETDQLREQAARQNAIISSLKKRVYELEERERNLIAAQSRHEIAFQTAQRDVR